jgi:hypothetical protein
LEDITMDRKISCPAMDDLVAEQNKIIEAPDGVIAEIRAAAPEKRGGPGGPFGKRLLEIKRRQDEVTRQINSLETLMLGAPPMRRRS